MSFFFLFRVLLDLTYSFYFLSTLQVSPQRRPNHHQNEDKEEDNENKSDNDSGDGDGDEDTASGYVASFLLFFFYSNLLIAIY